MSSMLNMVVLLAIHEAKKASSTAGRGGAGGKSMLPSMMSWEEAVDVVDVEVKETSE